MGGLFCSALASLQWDFRLRAPSGRRVAAPLRLVGPGDISLSEGPLRPRGVKALSSLSCGHPARSGLGAASGQPFPLPSPLPTPGARLGRGAHRPGAWSGPRCRVLASPSLRDCREEGTLAGVACGENRVGSCLGVEQEPMFGKLQCLRVPGQGEEGKL